MSVSSFPSSFFLLPTVEDKVRIRRGDPHRAGALLRAAGVLFRRESLGRRLIPAWDHVRDRRGAEKHDGYLRTRVRAGRRAGGRLVSRPHEPLRSSEIDVAVHALADSEMTPEPLIVRQGLDRAAPRRSEGVDPGLARRPLARRSSSWVVDPGGGGANSGAGRRLARATQQGRMGGGAPAPSVATSRSALGSWRRAARSCRERRST